MTAVGDPVVPGRRGVLAAEIAVLVVAGVVDIVLATVIKHDATPTLLAPLVVPAAGEAPAVLAVLRRRFPDRIRLLGMAVAALSLTSTAASVVITATGHGRFAYPGTTEVVAMALLTGAACRRLSGPNAAATAVAGGIAMLAAPLLRYGIGSPAALLAAPATMLWGIALAVGLILRDADTRQRGQLAAVRENERLQLARELHDLIAHHVSGIVVRAQAAHAIAKNPAATPQDPIQVYAEIEQAGAEALTATRQLVGMLRSAEPVALLPGAGLADAIRAAVATHGETGVALEVDVAAELDAVPTPPELAITAHRIVLESLTNVRRHAPDATRIGIHATVDGDHAVLDIHNDGLQTRQAHRGAGYGLVGMAERVAALGGSLRAGADRNRHWRLTARLPLHRTATLGQRPRQEAAE